MLEIHVSKPGEVVARLREMEFHQLADFNGGHIGVFWSEAGGPSPWEMHPECDELLHVIDGEIEVEILPRKAKEEGQTASVTAGSFIIIPCGCWHRQTMRARTKEMYLTPGPTEHSSAEDPRRT